MNANTTPQEFFKYFCTDDRAVAMYDKGLSELEAELEQAKAGLDEAETTSEQHYFALNVIDQIEEALASHTRLADFKKAFVRILEDSYLER